MIQKYMTAAVMEGTMGWPAGSVGPIHWLVIQEQAAGRKLEEIAAGLGVPLEDIWGLISEITGDVPGTIGEGVNQSKVLISERWNNAITLMKSVTLMNHQVVEVGWDAIEAMAVSRLAEVMSHNLQAIDSTKALEIAVQANKALRRSAGEGSRGTSINVSTRGGSNGESEMTLEMKGGHLGSMKLSLSQRVRAQLEQPRVIEAEVNQKPKEMLTLDDTRNLLNHVG